MYITEALAEIKTVIKRIQSKKEYITQYSARLDSLKDPLEKDGGSEKVIKQEMQALVDLEKRLVDLRTAINTANHETSIELEGWSKTIEEWLVWRRDVASSRRQFLNALLRKLHMARDQVRLGVKDSKGENVKIDLIVNVDEAAMNSEMEKIDNVLGQLDGQLSLKNATTSVDL